MRHVLYKENNIEVPQRLLFQKLKFPIHKVIYIDALITELQSSELQTLKPVVDKSIKGIVPSD